MKVAIYVRVSTTEQALEGYSIQAQIATLKNYCASYKYVIHKVYHDSGISGKNINGRPALLELIEDCKVGKFDCVLVWKLSRLSRSLLDLLSIVDIFSQHDVSFQSFSEKFDTSTPTGKMLLQMLGSIAEFERNTIIENVKLGMNERFKQGYSKGSIPFGYVYKDKKAVIVPEQAEIVKYIFETYNNSDDNNCLTDLAEYLNLKGYKTRLGGLWSRISIRDMLINHFYAGYVRTGIHSHGKRQKHAEVREGQHTEIISQELFESVNKKLDSNRRGSFIKNKDSDSLLTGLIICPLCGSKMFALNTYNRHKKKNGETSIYDIRMYRCTENSKGRIGCKGFYISANKVEPGVYEILNKLRNKIFINEIKKEIQQLAKENKKPINDNLKITERQLKDLYSVRDKYFKLFESGKVDMEKFADKINDILKDIEKLESIKNKQLTTHTDYNDKDIMNIIFESIDDLNNLDDLNNAEKKEVVRNIIKEVKITQNKELVSVVTTLGIEIYYHK